MTIRSRGQLIHLVSKNKWVRIWYQRLRHASNARIIWASKLLTSIGDFSAKYNLTKVYSDLKHSESDSEIESQPKTIHKNDLHFDNSVWIATEDDFNSIYLPCIASKQTCMTVYNKAMTEVDEKLDEVHVNLWGPHYPASFSEKTYAAILLDAKTQKTWVSYLCSKNEFVDVF